MVVTGSSGAGKTTLLSVLLGARQPDQGTVTISGGGRAAQLVDSDVGLWRTQLAWVDQTPYLFAGTIADTVRLSRPDADDRAVRNALDAAGLGAMSPARCVQERGLGLSAGEQRRLAIARAILRDAPLVLLDEPTAGLDAATETDVLSSIRALANRAIVIMVSHRPAALASADRVVTIESTSSSAALAPA